MDAGSRIAAARRRAGLTQRALADRAGVPQSTVGRIEIGVIDPRVRTVERLLRACGSELEVTRRLGIGIDRTQIRERLRLTPRIRIEETVAAAQAVERIRGRARRSQS